MVGSATDVVHELCNFEAEFSHEEMLGSIVLEEVVEFEIGADAGLPPHEKEALRLKNEALGKKKRIDAPMADKGMLSGLTALFPYRFSTSELEDYTILLTLRDRQVRLRCETGVSFGSWSNLFKLKIPRVVARSMHEGWMWRRLSVVDWVQRYAVIYEGVLYFFTNTKVADQFKLLCARDQDSVFVANKCCEGTFFVADLPPSPFILIHVFTPCN